MNTSLLQFELQQSAQAKLIHEIRSGAYIALVRSFNDSTQDYERQAVIEAAQELGYSELALELMQDSDLKSMRVC